MPVLLGAVRWLFLTRGGWLTLGLVAAAAVGYRLAPRWARAKTVEKGTATAAHHEVATSSANLVIDGGECAMTFDPATGRLLSVVTKGAKIAATLAFSSSAFSASSSAWDRGADVPVPIPAAPRAAASRLGIGPAFLLPDLKHLDQPIGKGIAVGGGLELFGHPLVGGMALTYPWALTGAALVGF